MFSSPYLLLIKDRKLEEYRIILNSSKSHDYMLEQRAFGIFHETLGGFD